MDVADQEPGAAPGTTDPVRSGLPVLPPVAALLEILVLIVTPGLLDYFVPGFPSLNETQPHFFWLPVVLLSVQYGSLSGLLAAGAAIMLASLLGWPEQDVGENHFSYLLRVWLQPVLWIATAVILGQFRLRQIEQKEALGRAVAELTSQRQSIAQHARNLRGRCEHLERFIAARHEPEARALLAALGRIPSDDAGVADAALHDTLRLAFGDCRVAVYVLDAGQLQIAARHGTGAGRQSPDTIGPGELLYGAAIVEARALSVLNPGDETKLQRHGLAAVPILAADRSVIGLLLLEAVPPAGLDSAATDRLAAIAAVIANRLGDTARPGHVHRTVPNVIAPERPGPPARRAWRGVKWRDTQPRSIGVRSSGRSG